MKRLIGFLIGIAFLAQLSGQKNNSDNKEYLFHFQYIPENIEGLNIDNSAIGSHPLGKDLAVKEKKFEKLYTITVQGTPTSPGTKMKIAKSDIFYGVKKAERYLKRAIRKNEMTKEQARKKYHYIIDIAVSIYNQQTEYFEKYLRDKRRKEDKYEAFMKVKLVK